jgi:hypothetical protein
MTRTPSSSNSGVIIAGTGIAAAAMALRLLHFKIPATLISLDRLPSSGIESIPEGAFPLVAELGLEPVLAEAGGELIETFENGWAQNPPVARQGKWLHVQRTLLAETIMREAVRRGAQVLSMRRLPDPGAFEGQYLAAIDGTGRSAAWSRPVGRHGNQVADLYEVPNIPNSPARIVKLASGWGYRLGAGATATVGLMSPLARESQRTDTAAASLGIDAGAARYLGRRPAFPQWCDKPVDGRRIALGDAAFAFDPIAGMGIRFALASAFAVTPLVRAWSDNSPDADVHMAVRFYERFVSQARVRHLDFLALSPAQPPPQRPISFPHTVIFNAPRTRAELNMGSRVVVDEAISVPGAPGSEQAIVRWVGGVDLLRVEELARTAVPTRVLIHQLASGTFGHRRVASVVGWCLRTKVLRPIGPEEA